VYLFANLAVSAADVYKTIVINYESSFLIMSVSGNTVTCKTAFSVGMEAGDKILAGTWYLADFSASGVRLIFADNFFSVMFRRHVTSTRQLYNAVVFRALLR